MLQHLHHTYIHHGTHSHTHTRATCEIHAHAHVTATVYYDPLQLTSSMHKAKDKEHRARAKRNNACLRAEVNTYSSRAGGRHQCNACLRASSAPIAQGLVYDINAPHAFGLRASKPNAMHAYVRSSSPIAQGLVYGINAPHAFGLYQHP